MVVPVGDAVVGDWGGGLGLRGGLHGSRCGSRGNGGCRWLGACRGCRGGLLVSVDHQPLRVCQRHAWGCRLWRGSLLLLHTRYNICRSVQPFPAMAAGNLHHIKSLTHDEKPFCTKNTAVLAQYAMHGESASAMHAQQCHKRWYTDYSSIHQQAWHGSESRTCTCCSGSGSGACSGSGVGHASSVGSSGSGTGSGAGAGGAACCSWTCRETLSISIACVTGCIERLQDAD